MNVIAHDEPSYNLTVKNGRFTKICLASEQEDPDISISQDGCTAKAGPLTVHIVADSQAPRLAVRYPDYSRHCHSLVNGVFRLSYRENGRPYSKHLHPADIITQDMKPLPFRFTKFRIGKCYQATETDGVFRHDWVTEGDLARELNWVFSDGEVTRRFVDHDQGITSLAAPALYDKCDTLETVVSKSSWTVHVYIEQRHDRGTYSAVRFVCSEAWIAPTPEELEVCLADYLKHRCCGVGNFLKPLEDFLL